MKNAFVILCLAGSFLSLELSAQSLKVTQVKDDVYKIDITAPVSKSALTWSNTPDSWARAQSLKISGQEESLQIASAHPIVKLKAKGQKEYFAAPRLLVLRGAVNFRDLGGYMTKDNKEVKWGKIYRSADISKLTDEDLVKLRNAQH